MCNLITPDLLAHIGTTEATRTALVTRRYIRKYSVATGQQEANFLAGDVAPPMFHLAAGVESIFQLDREMRDRVTEHLTRFVTEHAGGFPVETSLREGSPHREVARHAEESGADVIVIARRGHGGTPHPLGNVPERLLHDAKSPMLVV